MGFGRKSPGAHHRARLPRRASSFEGGLMAAPTSPTLFASAAPAPTPTEVADDHSLLTLDRELDFLLEQIEDEIEESGEASKEAMERLQLFCQAMNLKVDRIGRYLAVMKTRAAHCKEEAARYAARAKRAENKIARTESMVLYYLESHDLKQLETDNFTFRGQKNSLDSVIVRNAQAVPPELNRYELKVDGPLYLDVIRALPDEMASSLRASVKFTDPSNTAIKQYFASGKAIEGVEVKRLYHLRIA
jgi:Siphovirus Gp157